MEIPKAAAEIETDTSPRIEPIENPKSIKLKLAY